MKYPEYCYYCISNWVFHHIFPWKQSFYGKSMVKYPVILESTVIIASANVPYSVLHYPIYTEQPIPALALFLSLT